MKEALTEQQTAAWRLRALIQCVSVAAVRSESDDSVSDPEAAMDALAELAERIHGALDPDGLAARAAELEAESERAERLAERNRQAEEALRTDDRDPLGKPPKGLRLVKDSDWAQP
ncbi:MAG: hypothetical protein WBW93_17870 [Steroidobacteraceae bacterium]